MFKIAGFAQRSIELKEKARAALLSAGVDLQIRDNKSAAIRLVFAGQ